jgi:pterin-4a-carbinolamine dehydratase
MKTFNEQEIADYLSEKMKSWFFVNGMIKREFKFENFSDAFSFMTSSPLRQKKWIIIRIGVMCITWYG